MHPKSSCTPLEGWIPPTFSWVDQDDLFAITIPSGDLDLVEFVANGRIEVVALHSRSVAKASAALMPDRSLLGQLTLALWDRRKLRPSGGRVLPGLKMVAYCYGVFSLPNERTLCILAGRNEPIEHQTWLPSDIKRAAVRLVDEHAQKIAEIDEEIAAERKRSNVLLKEMAGRYEEDAIGALDNAERMRIARIEHNKPILRADRLNSHFPKAVIFPIRRTYTRQGVERIAAKAISASGWESPRDGGYEGVLANTVAIVTWTPHEGVPGYPEIRWAVQRLLPSALEKPRLTGCSRTEFDAGNAVVVEWPLITSPVDDPGGVADALDGLQLEEHDFHSRIDDIKKEIRQEGFDAIAWFQAYHIWSEGIWGIYVDARKLDDLALSLLWDLRQSGVAASDATAAFLALGLTYSHELFHARVEAASSWLELTTRRPRHLRYTKDVYDTVRDTDGWLEEALANWVSWEWFRADGTKALLKSADGNFANFERVVRASLDFSPPGYNQWRLGESQSTWRIFTNQLATGRPSVTNTRPLEGLLTGRQPYDFQPIDVPLRFVGAGVIADRLRANHKTFSQPTVRELEKALNYFGYTCKPSGGKGSHEKWTKHGKQFPVPRRDPISQGVFKAFLEQVGIDRKQYFAEVRPKL